MMSLINGIFSDETYEEQVEPEYDHDEEASWGDTSIGQIKAILAGTTATAAASASGAGAVTAVTALTAGGVYKAMEYGLEAAGAFNMDQKIENGEPHLDSEEAEPVNSLSPYPEER